ncbi:MAG: hypothetical protein J0L93_09880 [Deltaproteobacteria bacterium]|nr:hypothetical protein [Deltaproteobacteria bacterium]
MSDSKWLCGIVFYSVPTILGWHEDCIKGSRSSPKLREFWKSNGVVLSIWES